MTATTKHTYRVTLPSGVIATRTTNRTYTHLVVGRRADRVESLGVIAYAGSLALAEKSANKYRTWRRTSAQDDARACLLRRSVPATGELIFADVQLIAVDNPRA